jgi:sulfur carrier protein ThiS
MELTLNGKTMLIGPATIRDLLVKLEIDPTSVAVERNVEIVPKKVTPDPYTLMPDPIETLKAAEILVKEGFRVLPYINADPILAKRLQEAGTATVMPLRGSHWYEPRRSDQGPDCDYHRAGHRSCYRGRRDWSSVPCCGGNGDGSRRRPG